MKYGIWILIALLLVLHQDYWQWENANLDLGFLPRGLTYHIGISIAAGVAWYLATIYCWPIGTEDDSPQEPNA